MHSAETKEITILTCKSRVTYRQQIRPKRVCRVQWKSCSCWELLQRVRSLQENHLSSGHQVSMDQQKVHVAAGSKLNRRVWNHATGLGIWTLGRCTCLLFLYSKYIFTLKRVGGNSCHAGRLVDYRLYQDIDKGNLGKLPNLLLPLSNAYPYILFSLKDKLKQWLWNVCEMPLSVPGSTRAKEEVWSGFPWERKS